jgi:predicted dehydrogenase
MNSDIGIGMIGAGFMGRTYSECLAKYTHGAHLVAAAGGKRSLQLAEDYEIEHEETVESLIGRSDVDAIIITSPEQVHKEQTLMAAAAAKHVLVEKPMAPDLAQCDAMIEGCAQAEVKLMQVKHWRFRGVFKQAKAILREGRIGKVSQLFNACHVPINASLHEIETRPFYLDPAGGGMYMGLCAHTFDLIRFLIGGEATSIYGNVQSFGDHQVSDLSIMAQLTFDTSAVAQMWVSGEMPGNTLPGTRMGVQIMGDKGLLDLDGLGKLNISTDNGWETIWEQPALTITNPADSVRLEAYSAMVQEYIDAILEDREPSVTGKDGRAAVELCLAGLQSSREKIPVQLSSSLDR